jgi:hypothetical protein
MSNFSATPQHKICKFIKNDTGTSCTKQRVSHV